MDEGYLIIEYWEGENQAFLYKNYWKALSEFLKIVSTDVNNNYVNEDNIINSNNKFCINYRKDLDYILMYSDWEDYQVFLKKVEVLDFNEDY